MLPFYPVLYVFRGISSCFFSNPLLEIQCRAHTGVGENVIQAIRGGQEGKTQGGVSCGEGLILASLAALCLAVGCTGPPDPP